MRGGGTFTLSVVDVGLTSVGSMVSIGLCVLLEVQVAGPSGLDVTNMLIESVGVAGVSLTSTNHERQSATFLWAPGNGVFHQGCDVMMIPSVEI